MGEDRRHDQPQRRLSDRRAEKKQNRTDLILGLLTSFQFWLILWGCALVGVLVFTLVTYQRESSDRAARRATAQATAQASATQCLQSRPFLKQVNHFADGVREVGQVLLANNVRMHAITPPGTRVYATQTVNIAKLRKALESQKAFRIPIRTPAECRALARSPQ
jgi:acyl-CoA synthetase (AMP-forming)/AMP-acid ligase II